MVEKELQDVKELRDQQREEQAIAGGYMPDYVELNGIKLLVPTLSHQWFLAEVMVGQSNPITAVMVTAYVLSHKGEEIRNRVRNAWLRDKDTFQEQVAQFCMQFEINDLNDSVEKLMSNIMKQTKSQKKMT